MELIKSPNDKKEYRVITLQNGLTAMLISDKHPVPCVDEQDTVVPNEEEVAPQHSGNDSGRESVDDDNHESDDAFSVDSIVDTSEEELEMDSKKANSQAVCGKNTMAAAALCVGVGSFSDPDDIPGLAHFLEHMVFMGNEKYPKENYFDSVISKYGGSNNAYTDSERTIFHLDVRPKYLHEALDILAACFTSPLLGCDSMDREIEAVDSEFHLHSPSDSERMELLLGSCAKSGHPMTKFYWGNTKTLKDDPKLKNININEHLKMFWKRYYSSHCMTLAVVSTESLDVLESWVVDIFSSIPHNGLSNPTFESLEAPFKTDKFHKLYKIIPVKETHRIVITWALPSLVKWYRVKPLGYLAWLVGHEGKGSIISLLRKRSLAFRLEAGNSGYGFEHNSTCSLFRVTTDLTEAGMDDIFEVISVIFQYLKLLRTEGPQERVFQEIKAIEDNLFHFQEEVDKSLYVEEMVENMQCFPSEHYLVGDKLYFDFNKEIIKDCGDALTFEDANIMILSSRFANENMCIEKEPWTQASYCSSDFPEDWVKRLNELEVHPDLFLPEDNEYIATEFALKQELSLSGHEYPVKILEDDYGCLWYKKDAKFKVPKGYICFQFISSMIGNSPRNAAIMDVLMNCLNQIFSEDLYPAAAARLSYSLYVNDSGLVLHVDGFDHKLSHLFEQMLSKIVNFSASESLFDSMKNYLFKSYYNTLIKPGKLCKDIRLAIMRRTHWSIVDKRIALRDVSRQDLLDFSRTFLSNIFFVGLIQGNFTIEEALSLSTMVKKKTNAVPLKPDCFPKLQATKIPVGETFCCVSSFNTTDPNSVVVNYYQSGPGKIKTSCLMELLLSIMDEPCFDMLRTKETLGYDVSCSNRQNYGIIGFTVSVKSPGKKFSCSYIDQRIDAFLEAFAVKLQDLSEEEFYVQRASLIDLKKCDDLNLKEEVDRNWSEIVDRNYLFNRLHKEIECLQSLTLEELKCFGQEHLSSDRSRVQKLGVQVVGSSGVFPNTFKNVNESAHKGNAGGDEVFNLHFLRPSESDQSFINDVVEYKKGLELYQYCKIIS